VAHESTGGIFSAHAAPVIGDTQESNPSALDFGGNNRRACIRGVFEQLF